MKATLMLADFATVAEGKLTIVGGGWTITGPGPAPFAIALKLEVPWHQAMDPHKLRLELLDADGQPVLTQTPQGMLPITIEAEMDSASANIPVDVKPGTPIDAMLAFNLPPMPVAPGGRYEWRLSIDGKEREDWHVAFNTRPAEAAQSADADEQAA
jgi:hypothetical protein